MAESTNLGITLLQLGQSGKEVTINDAIEEIDKSVSQQLDVDTSAVGGGTLNLTTAQVNYKALLFSGTPGADFTITVPDGEQRFFAVRNSTGFQATFRTVSGTGFNIPATTFSTAYSDGINIYEAVNPTPSGLVWTDVPATHIHLVENTRLVRVGGSGIPTARLSVFDEGNVATGEPILFIQQEDDATKRAIVIENAGIATDTFQLFYNLSSGRSRAAVISEDDTSSDLFVGFVSPTSDATGMLMESDTGEPRYWFNKRPSSDQAYAFNIRALEGVSGDGGLLVDQIDSSNTTVVRALTLRHSNGSLLAIGGGVEIMFDQGDLTGPETVSELGRITTTIEDTVGSTDVQMNFSVLVAGTPTALLSVSGESGDIECTNGLLVGNTTTAADGTIRYTGSDIEARISGTYVSLSGGGVSIGDSIGSGTDGSVLFIENTGQLTQNNANFFWDDTSQRLGLGLNTGLQTRLHIRNTGALNVGLRVEKDEDGSTGSIVDLYHATNSTASGDQVGNLRYRGDVNAGANNQIWAELITEVRTETFNSEDADFRIDLSVSGAATEMFRLNSVGISTMGSGLDMNGGIGVAHTNTTAASLNLDDTHAHVNVDATGGNKTVVPPDASANAGRVFSVKKTDVSANTVTIDPTGVDTIDGSATLVLDTQYQSVIIQADGTNYQVLANNGIVGGGGSVNVSGTPVNNELAIWTAADTIEGDDTLTYDGSLLIVNEPSAVTTNPQTTGLFIGGGAGGQVVLAMNSGSVSHTFTALAPADVFAQDLVANNFGTRVLRGFGEASATSGIMMQGYKVGEPAGNNAAIIMRVGRDSGTGTTALASTSNILTLQNNGTPAVHTFQADGTYFPGADVTFADGDTDGIDSNLNGILFKKSMNVPLLDTAANRTLDDTDYIVAIDCTGGNRNANLPALSATTDGKLYCVKKNDNSGNTVTIVRNGSDTIDGAAANVTLSVAFEGRWLVADTTNTNWIIVGSF